MSLWTWFGGSVCGILTELNDVVALTAVPKEGESQEEWCARQMKAQSEVNTKLLAIFHGFTQVCSKSAALCCAPVCCALVWHDDASLLLILHSKVQQHQPQERGRGAQGIRALLILCGVSTVVYQCCRSLLACGLSDGVRLQA